MSGTKQARDVTAYDMGASGHACDATSTMQGAAWADLHEHSDGVSRQARDMRVNKASARHESQQGKHATRQVRDMIVNKASTRHESQQGKHAT